MTAGIEGTRAYIALPCDCNPPRRHGKHFRAIDPEASDGDRGDLVPLRPNREQLRDAVLGQDRKRIETLAGDEWHSSAFTSPALASRRIRRRPKLAARAARARANAARRASVAARRGPARSES